MVWDGSTYLTTNNIKLFVADIDCFCDGANPTIVKFTVVKGHDGLHARPNIVVWVNAKTSVRGSGCNIRVHEAEAFGRIDGTRIDIRSTGC